MAASSVQIEATLDLTGEFSLITGAAVITDNSAWGSIGVATPDTVKILLRILDPTGDVFYENAGWNTGVYTSPDLQLTDTTFTFTLPTDIAGDYIVGQYTVYTKCQVVEDTETTVVTKTFYQNVSAICNDITINVQGGVVAGTTEVNLTDNTNYATYTALSRTMILYPPPPSGQATQTGTNVDVIVYSGTVYTGVWTWKLTSDVTYTDVDGVSTTCRLTGQGTFNVQQSQLCKVLCLLKKYRTQVLAALTQKNNTLLLQTYQLAMIEYQFATNAYICGNSQTVIDSYIQKIYDLTGIDPDCDCGCDDGTSQVLLSVTTVDGEDGTDGANILYGSGAPASGTGAVGDTYINTANGFMYKKTGATTWTYQLTIQGAAGVSPVSMIHNDITDSTTTTNALETLKTFTMDAGQLADDGDLIRIRARFRATKDSVAKNCYIYLDGASIINRNIVASLISAELDVTISRTGSTTGIMDGNSFASGSSLIGYSTLYRELIPISASAIVVSGWANALTIAIKANDGGGNAITCELFQVSSVKYGTSSSTSSAGSHDFLLTAATTYTFDGTVTAYNPDGISLIGLDLDEFFIDGLVKSTLTSDYTFSTITGAITIPTAVVGAPAKIVYA